MAPSRCLVLAAAVAALAAFGGHAPAPADAAVTFRAASQSTTPGSGALTIAAPAGTAAGDVLVAQVTVNGGTRIEIAPPAGWTLVRRTDNGESVGQASFVRVAGASEPSSHAFTLSPTTQAAGGIAAYSGAEASDPVVTSGEQAGTSSSVAAPSVTTTRADGRVVALYGLLPVGALAPPAGMTERYDGAALTGPTAASADRAQPAAGATGTEVATASAGGAWVAQTLALRPDWVPWYAAGWTRRRTIAVDPAKVAGPLTDFPMLVSIVDADLRDHAQSDGDDILFTAADGTTTLAHEIERYVPSTGELQAWVKVPSLSATAPTTIHLYYGNAAATSQQDRPGVWDAGHALVEHFEEQGACPVTFTDSTANANGGSCVGSPAPAAGQIGDARIFDGADDEVTLPGSSSLNALTTNFSVETWLKRSVAGTWDTLYDSGTQSGDWAIQIGNAANGDLSDFYVSTQGDFYGATPLTDTGRFYHAAWVKSGDTGQNVTLYIDGVVDGTASVGSTTTPTGPKQIGSWGGIDLFAGVLDELRVSSVARSAAWVATSFHSQSSPGTFAALGAGESADALAPYAHWSVVEGAGAARQHVDYTSGTLYYNPSGPGDFTLSVSAGDAGSGLSQVAFPTIGGSGFAGAGGADVSAPFASSYAFDATNTQAPVNQNVAVSDLAGNVTNLSLSFARDTAPPTGGGVTYADGAQPSGQVTITTADGNDTGSGVASGSGVLERRTSDGSAAGCAAFAGAWSAVTSPDALAQGLCAQYRYRVSDRVGNEAVYTSANVAQVPVPAPAPVPVPAPPPAAPPALTVKLGTPTVLRGAVRRLKVPVTLGRAASLALRLTDARAKVVVSRVQRLRAGAGTLTLILPRTTRPGRYRLVATATATGMPAASARLTVRIPAA